MPIPNVIPLERAFQLARSGQCKTTGDIQLRLKAEGYTTDQVIGPALLKQLRAAITYRPPVGCRKLKRPAAGHGASR